MWKWLLNVSVFLLCSLSGYGRVVLVSVDRQLAMLERGQYVSKFCFQGQTGLVRYSLNQTIAGSLYLYAGDTWEKAVAEQDCHAKLKLANLEVPLNTDKEGERVMAQWLKPLFWYVIYADGDTSCSEQGVPIGDSQRAELSLTFLNPDGGSDGKATNHFGADEKGLLGFYQLLFLVYACGGYFFLHRLWEGISKGGPLNSVIKMVSLAKALQIGAVLLMMVHLWRYSQNGVGFHHLEALSEILETLSQFVMLVMLITLSMGWALGSQQRNFWNDKRFIGGLSVVAFVELFLLAWEQSYDEQHYTHHAHQTTPGWLMVVVRLALAGIFAFNLQNTMRRERSSLRRDFYSEFSSGCYIWFLAYPTILLLSLLFAEHRRHIIVTMGVGVLQTAAIWKLCSLFLSRSLYWSVSSLGSSMLPLRSDPSWSKKRYA